jgi:hypothetical protein
MLPYLVASVGRESPVGQLEDDLRVATTGIRLVA